LTNDLLSRFGENLKKLLGLTFGQIATVLIQIIYDDTVGNSCSILTQLCEPGIS
jgi:hypothetical protein